MPTFAYFIILWLLIAIIMSAFFSGAEIVYAKVNKLKLNRAKEENVKNASLACSLSEDYEKLIGSILVGNNLVNIGASSAATLLLTYFYPTEGALYSSIIMTIVILIFGEILPKTILSKFTFKAALAMAPTLRIVEIIFFPIVYPVNKLIDVIGKAYKPKEKAPTATDEELEAMVDEIEEEGFIDEDTSELLKSAIDFVDVMAYEIMIPRVDIIAIDIEDDIYELIKTIDFFKYSRLPVYENTIDNIIGVIKTNEVLKLVLKKEKIDLRKLMVKPIFIHKTKTISSVLQDFKKTGLPFSIVIDEFGGTLGVVTLEDILEELVGEIYDETDEIIPEYDLISENEYIVEGDLNIDDLFDLLDFEDDDFESEYSTVGGWITEMKDSFPIKGDKFDYKNLNLEVLDVDGVRVLKVKVIKTIESTEEDE